MLLSIDMEIFTDLSFLDNRVTNRDYFPQIIKCLSFYRASAERQNLSHIPRILKTDFGRRVAKLVCEIPEAKRKLLRAASRSGLLGSEARHLLTS